MNELTHRETEDILRQGAAERLTDIAYALTTGGPIELTINGERISVPMAEGVRLSRELQSGDGAVRLAIEMSWPTVSAPPASRTSVAQGRA